MLIKPLDYFGYFKSTKFDHKYTRFDRPSELGESTDSANGPKYKISNEETIRLNAEASRQERAKWVHHISGHPMKPKYNTTDHIFSNGYKRIKDPYFPNGAKKN